MLLHAALLYTMLFICGVLFVWLVRRHDLTPREPWLVLAAAAILGALAMWSAGQLQMEIIPRWHRWNGGDLTILQFALLAGVTEEVAKAAVVVMIFAFFRRWFNEAVDGIIYGSIVGLGAAVEESIAFFASERLGLLPMTEPVRLFGHLVMGGISGAGMGMVALRGWRWWPWPAASLAVGAAVHTVWDVIAFSASDAVRSPGGVRPWHTVLSMVIMLVGYVVYRSAVEVSVQSDRARGAKQTAA